MISHLQVSHEFLEFPPNSGSTIATNWAELKDGITSFLNHMYPLAYIP
jgi:hypothetical protein